MKIFLIVLFFFVVLPFFVYMLSKVQMIAWLNTLDTHFHLVRENKNDNKQGGIKDGKEKDEISES